MQFHFSVFIGYYLEIAGCILLLYFFLKLIDWIARKFNSQVSIYKEGPNSYFLMLGFSYIGMTLGLLIGLSINPVVQAVIPALLTFLTGFTAYIFMKNDQQAVNQRIAVVSLIFIPLFLMYGVEVGSKIRYKSEINYKKIDQLFKKDMENFKYNLIQEDRELRLQYLEDLKTRKLDSIEE